MKLKLKLKLKLKRKLKKLSNIITTTMFSNFSFKSKSKSKKEKAEKMAANSVTNTNPPVDFSPAQDCEKLKNAFQGLGTDEKAIIKILGSRNEKQIREIREMYQQQYNKSLLGSLDSELSGDFGKAVLLRTYDPAERDARLANEALKAWRKTITQLQVIVELACASTPHHLVAVRRAYCSLFDTSLEEDIIANVSQPVQKILVSLVRSYRYDQELVDTSVANIEAAILHNVIEGDDLDNDDLVQILSIRNTSQLKQTFVSYKATYGSSIDQDIMACGKGTLESVVKAVVWCIDSPEKHFAEVLRASIVGLGTDEDSLSRAIVSRADIDMPKIKEEYLKVNKCSLEDAVIGDTSGDYQDFLLTLIGADI